MKKKFLKFCLDRKFQQSKKQLKVLDLLTKFYEKKSFLKKILYKFSKSKKKISFLFIG